MKITSAACASVFLLCLMVFPAIDYLGGRLCEPLSFPPPWPAEVVPLGIGSFTGVTLLIVVVQSFLQRRQRKWTVAALGVTIMATAAYVYWADGLPGFLEGLRDRFVAKVGYDKMREFGRELGQTGRGDVIQNPRWSDRQSQELQKRWDDLVSRCPFLAWTHGAGNVIVRGGVVELIWGSPLTGHWGFQVAPQGKVKPIEEDRGRVLTVCDDIQFVYYFD